MPTPSTTVAPAHDPVDAVSSGTRRKLVWLPSAAFADPPEPNGIRVSAGLGVGLQCTMAVDSGGPDGVGVPDQASPTPDELLLEVPVQ